MKRDALAKQDARLLDQPLVDGTAEAMAAHVRHTVALLRDRRAQSPGARAAAHLSGLFERTVPRVTQRPLACRMGCSHCCHQSVAVYAPEAFRIAAALHERADRIAAVHDVEQRMRGKRVEDVKHGGWMRCSMLEDNLCAIYAQRPLGCRGFVSLDVNDCVGTFVLLGPLTIRAPDAYGLLGRRCRILMQASLRAAGLSDAAYELNSALTAILARDNAEIRWLDGEDIFAGVTICVPSAPGDSEAAHLAALVAPTL